MSIVSWVKDRVKKLNWGYQSGVSSAIVGVPKITGPVDLTQKRIDIALQLPAVWAAVQVLSRGIASVPIRIRNVDRGVDITDEARLLERMLNRAWNPLTTSYDARVQLMRNALLHGRGIAVILRPRGGRASELHVLEPTYITKRRFEDGRIRFEWGPGGQDVQVFMASDVIELVMFPESDGLNAYDPIAIGWPAIQAGLEALSYSAEYFSQGAQPGIVFTGNSASIHAWDSIDTEINARLDRMRKKSGAALFLPDGVDVTPIGHDPRHSQLLELQRFSVDQISRLYGVPTTVLGDLRYGTLANVEQESIRFAKHALSHWASMMEQQLSLRLFPKGQHEVELDLEAVLRGDTATRWNKYTAALRSGVMTPNEVRLAEGLGKSDIEGADELWLQGAMVAMSKQMEEPEEPEVMPFSEEGEEEEEEEGEENPMFGGEEEVPEAAEEEEEVPEAAEEEDEDEDD